MDLQPEAFWILIIIGTISTARLNLEFNPPQTPSVVISSKDLSESAIDDCTAFLVMYAEATSRFEILVLSDL